MLVYVARVHAVPSVELCHSAEVDEPVHLYSLLHVSWRMGRHPSAHISYLPQLRLAHRVSLFLCHPVSHVGMALSKEDGSVAADVHGLQLLLLVRSLGVVDEVELGKSLGYESLGVE